MADEQYEVMYRWRGGAPMRSASEEESRKARAAWQAVVAKWKEDGIEQIATFNSPAGPGEYGHTILWRLKNADQYAQMQRDLNQAPELMKLIERWQMVLGWATRSPTS